jgi:hypothetical protein
VANANCSTTSAILPLKIWQDAFGLEAALMVTLQAISGAGYPGVASLDIMDNVVPYIGGEDGKLESEPKKLLGSFANGQVEWAAIKLSAQANRVPVVDGHLASVSVKLGRKASAEEGIAALKEWQPAAIYRELPSGLERPLRYHAAPDRPQPRLDRDAGAGLAWTVGKVRECGVLDLRFLALAHNTLRGAASGSILNAELAVVSNYLLHTTHYAKCVTISAHVQARWGRSGRLVSRSLQQRFDQPDLFCFVGCFLRHYPAANGQLFGHGTGPGYAKLYHLDRPAATGHARSRPNPIPSSGHESGAAYFHLALMAQRSRRLSTVMDEPRPADSCNCQFSGLVQILICEGYHEQLNDFN